MDPNEELFEGCKTGNIANINNAIRSGANDFNWGLYIA
jgi:hypothetical protein